MCVQMCTKPETSLCVTVIVIVKIILLKERQFAMRMGTGSQILRMCAPYTQVNYTQ